MKFKLLQQIWKMTKLSLYGLLLQVFLYQFLWAENVSAQKISSVKEVHINVNFKNANLEEVFSYIESKTDFSFSYNIEDLSPKLFINKSERKISVASLLEDISRQANLKFKQVNKNISVDKIRNVSTGEKILEVIIQTRNITGKITSMEDGEGLPGVNVVEKGTSNGTVTDVMGNYSLNVSDGATLVFSSVGYTTEEVEIGGRSVIDLTMMQDIQQLQELVVVGYGTQKKSDLTAAISSIDGEDIRKFPVADAQNAIQGMAPGVEVVRESGAPGSSSRIRIRGIGSINNSSDPIVIIDGVIGDVNSVNPSDIKSVEILKDAAYAAVYGARAANGVILITTKSGIPGETKVSLNAFAGAQNAWKQPEPLGRDDYAMITREMYSNAGSLSSMPSIIQDIIDNPANYPDVNFMDNIFQSGNIQKYELSVSGGGENSSFYLSGGYYDEQGTIIETDHKRYNLRLNSTFDIGKLRIGENLGLVYRNTNGFTNERPKNNMILREAVWWTPFVPAYDETTSHGYGVIPTSTGNDAYNYVAVMELSDYLQRDLDNTGNVFAEYEFIEGLKYRLNVGVDYGNPYNLFHMRPYPIAGVWEDNNNYIDNGTRRDLRIIVENIATYSKKFGDHSLDLMGGYTQERFNMEGFEASGQGAFASNNISSLNQLLEANFDIDGDLTAWNLASYLGRVSYGYKGRYFLTALLRRDGSSKFGPEEKWGVFPSISAAWRISDEPFFNLAWMSNAKLRASRGTLGRLPDPNFAWVATLRTIGGTGFGNEVPVGAAEKGSFADAGLKWETETQTNLGVDLGFFEDKLTATADFYNRVTNDMLLQRPLPLSSGYDQASVNVGSMLNQGFEFSLAYRTNIGELNLGISGNMSMYRNEVLDIGGEDEFIESGRPKQHQGVENTTRTVEGMPVGSFYGYKTLGIYQNASDINETFAPNAVPGDVIFADLVSNNVLDNDDKTFIGNPFPDMTYGFNLDLGLKGFDFTAMFYGVQGIDIFNANLFNWRAGYSNFNQTSDILTRWTPENGGNKWPRVVLRDEDLNNNWRASDLYVEDGSYLRLRLATLGYTLPTQVTESLGLNKVRVYVQGQNLFTFTNYSGVDPEVAGEEAVLGRGLDEGDNYPSPRILLGGIQLDF